MITIFLIPVLIITILIVAKILLATQFNNEIKQLFNQSNPVTGKTFHYELLFGLPEPVQRYFKYCLKEGQFYISYARLKHDGLFKTDKNKGWINIEGEQYFTMQNPGFIWRGVTTMFTARDMYIAGTGRLIVNLFSIFKILNKKGEKINQGELLRWLGESVWFPTNLLPDEKLKWTSIDFNTAKLTYTHSGLTVFYIVTFNEAGEITQLETKRFMGEENLETWIGKLSGYKNMNGIIIPTEIEAIWKTEKEDYSYAKFNVKKIEYDKPEKF